MPKQRRKKSKVINKTFENSVFINCPFDNLYKDKLIAIFYTVIANNLNPIIAGEEIIGDRNRNEVLVELIKKSKYGIHDLSKVNDSPPRYNMPFEFGIFFGCKFFGDLKQKGKRFIIFEEKRNDLKKVITDVNGLDPFSHENDPYKIIQALHNWLSSCHLKRLLTKPETVIAFFNGFLKKYNKNEIGALDTKQIIEIIHQHYSFRGFEELIETFQTIKKVSDLKTKFIAIP